MFVDVEMVGFSVGLSVVGLSVGSIVAGGSLGAAVAGVGLGRGTDSSGGKGLDASGLSGVGDGVASAESLSPALCLLDAGGSFFCITGAGAGLLESPLSFLLLFASLYSDLDPFDAFLFFLDCLVHLESPLSVLLLFAILFSSLDPFDALLLFWECRVPVLNLVERLLLLPVPNLLSFPSPSPVALDENICRSKFQCADQKEVEEEREIVFYKLRKAVAKAQPIPGRTHERTYIRAGLRRKGSIGLCSHFFSTTCPCSGCMERGEEHKG